MGIEFQFEVSRERPQFFSAQSFYANYSITINYNYKLYTINYSSKNFVY